MKNKMLMILFVYALHTNMAHTVTEGRADVAHTSYFENKAARWPKDAPPAPQPNQYPYEDVWVPTPQRLPRYGYTSGYRFRSPLGWIVLVKFNVIEKALKNRKNKTRLDLKIRFSKDKHNKLMVRNGPKSSVQFLKTKNGLKIIQKKRLKHSSRWLPWTKKVAKKILKRYEEAREYRKITVTN